MTTERSPKTRGATRRRILTQLCTGRHTANELATKLGISGNAVRDHLTRLAGEDLVRHSVERRGVGKPTHVYELTADGELLTSKAYVPVLSALLDSAAARSRKAVFEELLREAGRQLARTRRKATGGLRSRTNKAAAVIEDLGGVVNVERQNDGYVILGRCCPLAHLSRRVPASCKLMEAMLAEVAGIAVHENCKRGAPPRCRFDISSA